MEEFSGVSLKVKNFKCFGNLEQGFDEIKPINLIIGRNNSGKSTLLDLIELVVGGGEAIPFVYYHKGQKPEIIAEAPLTEEEVELVFRKGVSGGGIPGRYHWDFGKQFVGTKIRWDISAPVKNRYIAILDHNINEVIENNPNSKGYISNLADRKNNPFSGKVFRRISAERNIIPEPYDPNLQVAKDGRGLTNIIQNFINKAGLSSDLVEVNLLRDLNNIFIPDAKFTDIVCQQLDDNSWEIYLEEDGKGRIPLSQSGSGLKTIIQVLVYLHLIPVHLGKDLSKFIFGFEELENNLHPALLRRLLSYIYSQAKLSKCMFFLTTHSNVEIDLFSKDKDTQILHIRHDGDQAYCQTVKTYIENRGILDDLDVRASDLLQSNGIIWVEGPSDRIYLNKWINLWSDGNITEGNHYQCIFYGGRLLSHLSSEEPELVEGAISILKVNKNSIILIDSDKRAEGDALNTTKLRIIEEINNNGGLAWITQGKEIENYISSDVISLWLEKPDMAQVGQYDNFFAYLDSIEQRKGHKYSKKKHLLAEELVSHMTKDNLEKILDLSENLNKVCEMIRTWNNMR